jgi:hypothetical protein
LVGIAVDDVNGVDFSSVFGQGEGMEKSGIVVEA